MTIVQCPIIPTLCLNITKQSWFTPIERGLCNGTKCWGRGAVNKENKQTNKSNKLLSLNRSWPPSSKILVKILNACQIKAPR